MGKRETRELNEDMKRQQATTNRAFGGFIDANNRELASAGSRYSPASSHAGYSEFAETGGYDEGRKSSIMDQVGQLKEFGKTGGLDSTATARMRGLGGFDEFAATGGYSPTDRSNIRARALSPIGAIASASNNELERRRNVQGGYGPGFDAASRAIRRDAGRGIVDASLGAELEIMDRVNQGRQWGISGVAGAEGDLQRLKTNNMYAGMTGAGDMEMGLQDRINSGRLAGLGGVTNTEQFSSGLNFADRQAAWDRALGAITGQAGANANYFGVRTPVATAPGLGTNIIRAIGAVGGAAAPFFNFGSNSNNAVPPITQGGSWW